MRIRIPGAVAATVTLLASTFLHGQALDPSFGDGGRRYVDFGSFDIARTVHVQPDGKIVLAGRSGAAASDAPSATPSLALARLLPSGLLDTSYAGGKVLDATQ